MSTVANSLLGSVPGNTAATTTSTGSGLSGTVSGIVSGVTGSIGSTVANGLEATIFSSRVIAIVLGLILITGAILLYIGEDLSGAIEAGGKIAAKVSG